MLGFRISRLTTRIGSEDEMLFGMFRDSQYLIKKGILASDTVTKLTELDTAPPRKLLTIYQSARHNIIAGMKNAQKYEDETMLLSLEKRLDAITHSKQQGRDIVELLSLAAFALVTIGLGLLLRAKGLYLNPHQPQWSGFLSEIFILLFVSTIAFLCINIFDIRRERETPLLLRFKGLSDDYQLFFRYKRDLRIQHRVAISISILMSVIFCGLLATKWL